MKNSKSVYNADKENSIFAVKLRGLFEETKRTQQELIDFIQNKTGKAPTRQAVSAWTHGNSPDIKTVPIIAEFFKVSTDYLLTETQIRPIDVELTAVCNYTGLSEKAVEKICQISKSPDPLYSTALNLTLSSPYFAHLILSIRQWLNNLSLLKGAIDIFKQKIREYGKEPPKDIMKFAAEISLSNQSCVSGEAFDIMQEQDNLSYCEYKVQNFLKKLLDELKKEG